MASERGEKKGRKPNNKNDNNSDECSVSTDIEDVVQRAVRKELDAFKLDIMKLLSEKFGALEKRIVEQDRRLDSLKHENAEIRQQLAAQAVKLDDIETITRLENLIIKGLPEQTHAERAAGSAEAADSRAPVSTQSAVEAAVISLCNDKLNLALTARDISSAYRIKKGPKDSSRPILVRFSSRKIRDEVYGSKKVLKGSTQPIFISEHLSKSVADLYYEARKMFRDKKLIACWTMHGQLFVRFTSDPGERPALIQSRSDFNKK